MKQSPELTRAAAVIESRARAARRTKRKNQQLNGELLYLHRHHAGMSLDQIVNSFANPGAKAMNLYNCKSVSDGYRITKFTRDYEVESSYIVSAKGCDCPAGARPVCRHRTMLPFFIEGNHVDDGWFFVWDTRQWLRPILSDAEELQPQGVLSTSDLPEPLENWINEQADEIEQQNAPSPDGDAAQPAPPTEPTPIAPQTEPASAEDAGFKFRRPKI